MYFIPVVSTSPRTPDRDGSGRSGRQHGGVAWAIPELNTRETAVVSWSALLLAFLLTKPEIRRGFLQLAATMFGSIWVIGPILAAGGYMVGVVFALERVGYWTPTMTKITVVWFVGGALVALFNTKDVDVAYYRVLVLRNAGLVVIVEFLSNVHTFPLPVELVFVPLATLLAMTQVVAEASPEYVAIRKPLAVVTTLLGLTALALSLNYVAANFDRVATATNLKQLALPLVLAGCFVPFLVAMRYVTVWQTMLRMVRAGTHGNHALYLFARREIVRACGISLGRAQLFESRFRGRLWGVETETDVSDVVQDFRKALARVRSRTTSVA